MKYSILTIKTLFFPNFQKENVTMMYKRWKPKNKVHLPKDFVLYSLTGM